MDRVTGYVLRVIDGDTFELDIDNVGRYNRYPYNDVERVRLYGIDAPELNTNAGQAAKARLSARIQGQQVTVSVRTRDCYRRLVGDVSPARRSR